MSTSASLKLMTLRLLCVFYYDIAKQQGVRMFTGEFWHQPDETDYETMIAAAAAFLRGHLDRVYRS